MAWPDPNELVEHENHDTDDDEVPQINSICLTAILLPSAPDTTFDLNVPMPDSRLGMMAALTLRDDPLLFRSWPQHETTPNDEV